MVLITAYLKNSNIEEARLTVDMESKGNAGAPTKGLGFHWSLQNVKYIWLRQNETDFT